MLPKPLRLRSRRDFKQVYQRGQTVSLPTMVLYWRKNGGLGKRIGFSVSKKLGGAVERNRVKRRCRAAAHELLPKCPSGFDLVFVARPAAAKADYSHLQADMAQTLALAAQKREHGKKSHSKKGASREAKI